MSRAKKTTTGWRRRYLVTHWPRSQQFRVMLVRGRTHRTYDGSHHVLVAWSREDKFQHYVLGDPYDLTVEKMFEASERDEMLAYITAFRMQGYTPVQEVPSW